MVAEAKMVVVAASVMEVTPTVPTVTVATVTVATTKTAPYQGLHGQYCSKW